MSGFTGTVRTIGPSQAYPTISAALAVAADGDVLLYAANCPRESITSHARHHAPGRGGVTSVVLGIRANPGGLSLIRPATLP